MQPQDYVQAELLSPRRSRRVLHKAVDSDSPSRPSESSAVQTGYDSDDEGEGERGGAEEAEEPDDAPTALPPPCATLPRDDGAPMPDVPGPRLLDGYVSDPCGADAERRARRRALRRSIGRRAGAFLAFSLSSCAPLVPCKLS